MSVVVFVTVTVSTPFVCDALISSAVVPLSTFQERVYESFVKYSEALNNIDLNLSEKNCIEAIKNSNNSVRINQQYKTEINSIIIV